MKTLLSAVVAASLAVCAVGAAAEVTHGERRVALTIESTSLATALDKWAQQSGFQIFYDRQLTNNLIAPSINGTYAAQEALEALLASTPLTYVWVNEKAVSIRKRSPLTVPATLQRTGLDGQQSSSVAKFSGDAPSGLDSQQVGSSSGEGNSNERPRAEIKLEQLEEVIVTGTYIRGNAPIGASVSVLTKQDIDKSGFATVQDVLRIVPQNFGATLSEVEGSLGNFTRGTGADLRGLGTGATLTLVNGRRQPASGGGGDFVDVDSIPTSAIERIEVLPDGASAIYGSDAVGGVVNIILRDRYEGAETMVRYASAGGDSNETAFSQLFGGEFGEWNALLGYQYYERTALRKEDRSFAASADKTAQGGSDYRSEFSNPGNILDPNTFLPAYAIPSGQDGRSLTPDQLLPGVVNLEEPYQGSDLLPKNKTHAGFFSLSRRFGDAWRFFADGRLSSREFEARTPSQPAFLFVPPTHPFYVDPFGSNEGILLEYSVFDDLGPDLDHGRTKTATATVGSEVDIANDWRVTGYATYGAEESNFHSETLDAFALDAAINDPDPATVFNPFGDGSNTNPATLATLRAIQENDSRSRVSSFNLLADGTAWKMSAGAVRVAVGGDYRKESLDSSQSLTGFDPTSFSGDRNVSALFGEMVVPIVASARGSSTLALLEASLAGRYERYSDFGDTFNPKVGIRYRPSDSIALRGSWGTSFKAPRLVDMNQPARSIILELPDPQSASGAAFALVQVSGGDLTEETAESWTLGIDWSPQSVRNGFAASLSYYDIDYTDRIITPGPLNATDVLLEEQQWQEVIVRNPTAAELAPLCAQAAQEGYDCNSTQPTVIFDARLRNIAALRTRGLDLSLQQQFEGEIGRLVLGFAGNYVLDYELQLTSTSAPLDLLDTSGKPVDLRMRATASWNLADWSIDIAANYTDGYRSNANPDSRPVSSFTTVDFGAAYHIPTGAGLLSGADVALRVVNVFDRDPPFFDSPLGFDPANASGLGRLVSAQLTKAW